MPRFTLRAIERRLIVPLMVASTLAAGSGALVLSTWLHRTLEAASLRRAQTLVGSLHNVIEIAGESTDLQRLVTAFGGEEDVRLIVVATEAPPRVIAATRHAWIGDRVDQIDDAAVSADLQRWLDDPAATRSLHSATGDAADPAYRREYVKSVYLSTRGGTPDALTRALVYVQLDTTIEQRRIVAAVAQGAALLLGTMLLLVATCIAVARRAFVRPLLAISAAMQRRRAGDTTAYAPVGTADEMGALAITLNEMIDTIGATETRLRQITDYIDDAFWVFEVVDGVPTYRYASPAFERLTGYPLERLHGDPALFASVLHPDDVDATWRGWHQMMLAPAESEWRIRHPNGAWRWMRMRGYPIRDDTGELTHLIGVTHDVTADRYAQDLERDQARLTVLLAHEQARKLEAMASATRVAEQRSEDLAAAEERLRTIVDSAIDAVIMMDEHSRIVLWNPQAARMFGWRADEIVGRSLAETIIPPAQRQAHHQGIAHFLATGAGAILGQRVEVTALHRDGREFPVELAVSAQRHDGRWAFSAFARDITLRKEAEDSLIRAREAALEASRLKSEFLATMSHEIRTPMNGVIGMADLLLDTPLDDDQRDFAETIRRAGNSLVAIINDILDFSKIESGRLELETADFAIREIVDDVVGVVTEAARSKGLRLVAVVDPQVPAAIAGDAGRVRQVLVNLTGNAVKFTDSGEVVIRVAPDPTPGGTAHLQITVTDTGIGLTVEARARLFQPFLQGDGSMTRRFGGTGLGLAISRQLVELMGGTIGADSEAGRGSTFRVRLPLVSAHPTPGSDPPPLDGRQVLLVQSHATERAAIAGALTHLGARVVAAPDARSALHAVRQGDLQPDTVVLDGSAAADDPVATLRALRRLTGVATLPAVLFGGSDAARANETWRGLGRVGACTAPLRHHALLQAVERLHAAEPSATIAPPRAAGTAGARILVAEDNDVNIKVFRTVLQAAGYVVDVARNGREAVAACRRASYAAILMDCAMPEMNGYEATGAIRATETGGRHTPIVAVTANALDGDRERCLSAGMDDYLSKPVRVPALLATVARWVDAGSSLDAVHGNAAATARQLDAARAPRTPARSAIDRDDAV